MNLIYRFSFYFILLSILPATSLAGVIMMGTRIILNEGDSFKEVILRNEGDQSELVQVWMDKGEANMNSSDNSIPLMPTPSVFKISAHSEQSVRINLLKSSLSKQTENMYWFNFMQIYPKSKKYKNNVDFSLISAVKVFYRSDDIKMRIAVESDGLEARFYSKDQLIIKNTTPYHVNLSGILDYGLVKGCQDNVDGIVIVPFSEMKKKLNMKQCHPNVVTFDIIEDDGNIIKKTIGINYGDSGKPG